MSSKLLFQQRTSSGLANIGEYFAAYENPNLLHNWDFTKPVNQRGATTYLNTTKQIMTIDRWKAGIDMKVEVLSGGIRLTGTNAPLSVFRQHFEDMNASRLAGMTVTISLNVAACTGNFSCYFLYGSPATNLTSGLIITAGTQGVRTATIVLPNADTVNNNLQFIICCSEGNGASLTLKSAKVEIGAESTLAQSAPMDYSQALSCCQRYCIAIDTPSRFRMTDYATDYLDFNIPLSTQMRAAPSLESGEFQIRSLGMADSGLTITNYSLITYRQSLLVRVTSAAHGLTDALLYIPSGRVVISADI